jgi:predicted solute-binding protein
MAIKRMVKKKRETQGRIKKNRSTAGDIPHTDRFLLRGGLKSNKISYNYYFPVKKRYFE